MLRMRLDEGLCCGLFNVYLVCFLKCFLFFLVAGSACWYECNLGVFLQTVHCHCSFGPYMQLVTQYPFHSWGQLIYLQLLFCLAMFLEEGNEKVVELLLWKRCRSFLLVIVSSRRVEGDKMRFHLSLSLSLYIYIYIYTSTLLFNAIFDVTADSPSSKHVPEAHFKLYAIESGTSFGLPQNVWTSRSCSSYLTTCLLSFWNEINHRTKHPIKFSQLLLKAHLSFWKSHQPKNNHAWGRFCPGCI